MDSYIDIRLHRDPEFPATQLMSALYAKLHRALVAMATDRIGVSFPSFKATLGEVMRIHGSAEDLLNLQSTTWLVGMRDHLEVSPVQKVPQDAKHRQVRRVQAKTNVERLRRRLMRRHDLSEAEARLRIPDEVATTLSLPFVSLSSASTGQKFRLFISHEDMRVSPVSGSFNAYGLSDGATVPWF